LSRAFVKELDGATGEELPELAVSPHRNLVTSSGLGQIEEAIRRLNAELTGARSADDRPSAARVERDLRYWNRRRATAEVVTPAARHEQVRFGCRVQLAAGSGERVAFRIVGEDESDPASGLISYVSPLALSLMGGSVGDSVPFMGAAAEIVSID
jgi:transcription elongation GreA/GreB family factor